MINRAVFRVQNFSLKVWSMLIIMRWRRCAALEHHAILGKLAGAKLQFAHAFDGDGIGGFFRP